MDEDSSSESKPSGKRAKRLGKKARAKAKAAAAKAAAAKTKQGEGKTKASNNAMMKKALSLGACFKWQKGLCKAKKCKYAHKCSVCGKEGCAASKHNKD